MIVSYQSLVDGGHLDVPGVPEPVAINALRKAAIEFCDRSRAWVTDHDPIDLIAEEATYQFSPNNGTVVVRVEEAWVSGKDISPTTRLDVQRYANWTSLTGTPTHYLQENTEEIILFQKPASSMAEALTMKVSLKPSRRSTGIEGWLVEKYLDEIVHGALWRLLEMPSKPWSEGNSAMYHKGAFDAAIISAQLAAQKGLGKAPLRTRPQYF
ncbi:MAG: hypothetical protein Q7T25_01165 [Sideroxyarcus sp.]|nr:hypothetical protein [Sideroxyarcus sp.]